MHNNKKQKPDPAIIINRDLAIDDEDRYLVNSDYVREILGQISNVGHNLVTLMGGEPLTVKGFSKVVSWITNHPTLNGLIYSSSAYFLNGKGEPNRKLHEFDEAGLFSREFGYFKSSVDMLILDERELPPPHHPMRGDAYKSYKGLQLVEHLASQGKKVGIHQTLKTYTLQDAFKLYNWARERNVIYTCAPMNWVPYVSRGESELFYSERLTEEHEGQLKEFTDYVYEDTIQRAKRGLPRICHDSSSFLRLMPKFGPNNSLSCRDHRNGIRPNGHDIHPNGQARWCIAQNSAEDGHKCNGCFYKGIDRDGDFENFAHLAGVQPSDISFSNGDVAVKHPNYNPTGANLFYRNDGLPVERLVSIEM